LQFRAIRALLMTARSIGMPRFVGPRLRLISGIDAIMPGIKHERNRKEMKIAAPMWHGGLALPTTTNAAQRQALTVLEDAARELNTTPTGLARVLTEGGFRVSGSAVRSWFAQGGTGIPAGAILVAARVAGLSLDPYIRSGGQATAGVIPKEAAVTDAQDRAVLREVMRRQEIMLRVLMDLVARSDYEPPQGLDWPPERDNPASR
ncbi:MAG TPA: hypothetical protein VF821_28090, partial [Lentzea sp.]